jgi:uncharacterized protein (DUF433 family)
MTFVKFPSDKHSDIQSRRIAYLERSCFKKYVRRHSPTAKPFDVSIKYVFEEACREIPSVASVSNVLGGTPCISGTRVPVYMVVEAVCHHGNMQDALKWYPHLTIENVKDALRFCKVITECPVDNQVEATS